MGVKQAKSRKNKVAGMSIRIFWDQLMLFLSGKQLGPEVLFKLAKTKLITPSPFQPAAKSEVFPSSRALCLSWPSGRVDWREDMSVIPTSMTSLPNLPAPKGPWLTGFGPNLRMGATSCHVCVFTCVFMETAVPFRYTAEVHAVQISEQEERETGRGRPVGDLPLLCC